MSDNEMQSESSADEIMQQKEFGSPLRAAREAAQLSLNDISEALKLSIETIKAMESSRVELLPPPAFTLGYIRNYARFLKISENEILDLYHQHVPDNKASLSARSSLVKQAHSDEIRVKLISYGFILVSIIVMLVWWMQSSTVKDTDIIKSEITKQDQNLLPMAINETMDEQSDSTVNTIEQIDTAPVVSTYELIDSANEVVKQVAVQTEKPVKFEKEIEPEPVIEQPTVNNSQSNKADIKADSVKAEDSSYKVTTTVTDEFSEFLAPEGKDVLILGTITESWAEIQDANKSRLVFQLIKKGGFYRIIGQAPFNVFLGNAPTISLQINEKEVKVIKYVKAGNIAHLQIFADGQVTPINRQTTSPEME